tara:strand:+ start:61 stop:597 length:537 start_codon:yes stop_codon:yes gene_type:complete
MKITRKQLRQIIKEEILREQAAGEPDGMVPTDAVAQAAAQSAAKLPSKREHDDPVRVVQFLEDLDDEQMEYSGKRFMDQAFEEWLLDSFKIRYQKLAGGRTIRMIKNPNDLEDPLDTKWSGFYETPPTPFPRAGAGVVGQKFAGFARVNNDVFSSDPEKKASAIAEFLNDGERDTDLT